MSKSRKSTKTTPPPATISFTPITTAYLGQKGYTIPKTDITPQQQELLKNTLIAKPMVNGVPTPTSFFPIYRESPNKIYVPRYFGEETFGQLTTFKIPEGSDIDLPFHGSMRDIQETVIQKYIDHVSAPGAGGGGGLLELFCGFGKTICALNIISRLRKKTIIIVHKEFLMNQWIERIQQFLPTAKIGKIQAQIIDIDGKDIVIGMLQSLSMKDYPPSMFDTFGLMIIDEVHHISSQVFSNVLFKLVTKYTLGLSATMNRKDGTTKIFKMFLGDVIYKCVRDNEDNVIVRAFQYKSDNEKFNEVLTDYRGNVMYSSMISKLCTHSDRTEYILSILKDMIQENSQQQIMILAHNKNILKYLYDAIKHRDIATVGYYVGGMKEADLKISETKMVIIATYSMAAEALDIKTLTTLIMATPKTDIEQAVGRILREKHGNPMVVDIIDQHQPFKNQWNKRRSFYKKQNYKIVSMNGIGGGTMTSTTSTTKNPKSAAADDDDDNEDDSDNSSNLDRKCLINLENMD